MSLFLQKQITKGVIYDSVGIGHHFGDVTVQPVTTAKAGVRVEVEFRSSNPRNDLRTEGTFLAVQLLDSDGISWVDVATDGNWETKFEWSRPSKLSAESFATIVWDVPLDAVVGTYRIQHYNSHKSVLGKITEFSGTSNTFKVTD